MITLSKLLKQLADIAGGYNDREKINIGVLGQQVEDLAKFVKTQGSKQQIKNAVIEHAFIPGGEIRFGTGTPGSTSNPFTGVRISAEGMTYGSTTYYIANVYQNTVTSGTNISTGEQETGAGAVLFNTEGIVIEADETTPWLTFKDENGTIIATIFQDGAGNLQLDIIDSTKGFTINDGNVYCGHAAGVDSAYQLHENFVRKASFWWDATYHFVNLENEVAGGSIFIVLDGGTPGSEFVNIYDRDAGVSRFRLSNTGHFHLRKTSTKPDYEDGYAKLYFYSDGAGDDVVQIRSKIGATETETTIQDVTP